MAKMARPYAVIGTQWKPFPTYKELKSNVQELISQCPDKVLTVFRSRRGEWGEWFEKWMMINGKPKIIKQGWM
jgi:hypothetical protein